MVSSRILKTDLFFLEKIVIWPMEQSKNNFEKWLSSILIAVASQWSIIAYSCLLTPPVESAVNLSLKK